MKNSKDDVSAACNDYLKVLGLIALAYSWIKVLDICYKELSKNKSFLKTKLKRQNFFFNRVLPCSKKLSYSNLPIFLLSFKSACLSTISIIKIFFPRVLKAF